MKKLSWFIAIFLVIIVIMTGLFLHSLKDEQRPVGPSVEEPKTMDDKAPFWKSNTPEDFEVFGVSLESSGAEVLRTLGQPRKKEQTVEPSIHNPDYQIHWETWVYSGLEIHLMTALEKNHPAPNLPERVIGIIISKSNYATERGVKVGDPVVKVTSQYGRPEIDDGSYTYHNGGLSNIGFDIKGEKVTKIQIWAEFD